MRRAMPFRSLCKDRGGQSAVEFALLAPFMIVILMSAYAYCEVVSISRKVTITTRALADLTTQYTTLSSSDMSTIMQASAQIIAPFNATPLNLRISEVTVQGGQKKAKVVWSSAYPSSPTNTAYTVGSKVDIPDYVAANGTTLILSEVSYAYTPSIASKLVGTFTLSDDILMLPRLSSDIDYSGS